MRVYSSLSGQTEDFQPLKPPDVGIYTCGPTVYDYQHIGHLRRYVGDDILVRVLKANGYRVKQVMNITDVGHLVSDSDTGEDKMEKGARKFGKSVWEIARMFEEQFFHSSALLGIQRPQKVMRATDYIKEQVELVQKLEHQGYTYKIADGIYFDTSKFPNYRRLSGQNSEELKVGIRVEMVEGKKHPSDFALWKFEVQSDLPRRQMSWWFKGPFRGQLYNSEQWRKLDRMVSEGKYSKDQRNDFRLSIGFPGWHIECSAMAMAALGETLDIHTGGIDHIAIHHTNEIAQSEAATGKRFVHYWVHHAFLLVEGQKMSKSLGNIFTVDDVVKHGFEPMALRYLYLQTHYRREMNFTWKALEGAQNAYERLTSIVAYLNAERKQLSGEKLAKIDVYQQQFMDAIDDDLNMPAAIATLWEVGKSNISSDDKYDLIMSFDEVLGLRLGESQMTSPKAKEIPLEIKRLVEEREKLRREKKWEEADELRKQIEEMGYTVKDTVGDSQVKRSILR